MSAVGVNAMNTAYDGSLKRSIWLYQGLPDGHLQDGGLKQIFEEAGFKYPSIADRPVFEVRSLNIRNRIYRPHDIPENMRGKLIDIGVTGKDFLLDYYLEQCMRNNKDPLKDNEYRHEFVKLLDFGCRPSYLVFLIGKDHVENPPASWDGVKSRFTKRSKMRSASEYRHIMDYLLRISKIPHDEVRYLRGKEESYIPSASDISDDEVRYFRGNNGYDCVIGVAETGESITNNPGIQVVGGPILRSVPTL